MQQQKIGADSVFAIYGAATTGAIIYRNLVQQGLQVGCFIDRRYAEIDSYFDVPVLSVEEFAQKFDKNTIVIVAVKKCICTREHCVSIYRVWILYCCI